MKRTFVVFTEPHVGDPVLVVPLAEIAPNGETIQYSNTAPLEELLDKMKIEAAERSGYGRGMTDVLSAFGLTVRDFVEKAATNKAARAEGLNGPQPAKL